MQLLIVLMSRGLAIFNTLIHNIFLQEKIYNLIHQYFHYELQYIDIVIILVLIVMVVSWWCILRKECCPTWIEELKDLQNRGLFTSDKLDTNLQFCLFEITSE